MLPRHTNRTFFAIASAPQSRTIFACFRTIVHFYVFYGQEANKLAYCIKSAFDVSIQRRRCAQGDSKNRILRGLTRLSNQILSASQRQKLEALTDAHALGCFE
jgi:hypothetical protein